MNSAPSNFLQDLIDFCEAKPDDNKENIEKGTIHSFINCLLEVVKEYTTTNNIMSILQILSALGEFSCDFKAYLHSYTKLCLEMKHKLKVYLIVITKEIRTAKNNELGVLQC